MLLTYFANVIWLSLSITLFLRNNFVYFLDAHLKPFIANIDKFCCTFYSWCGVHTGSGASPIDPTRHRAKLVNRLLRNSETTVGFQFYVDRFQSCLSLLISARLDWKILWRYTKRERYRLVFSLTYRFIAPPMAKSFNHRCKSPKLRESIFKECQCSLVEFIWKCLCLRFTFLWVYPPALLFHLHFGLQILYVKQLWFLRIC